MTRTALACRASYSVFNPRTPEHPGSPGIDLAVHLSGVVSEPTSGDSSKGFDAELALLRHQSEFAVVTPTPGDLTRCRKLLERAPHGCVRRAPQLLPCSPATVTMC
jgi:hypothetical protein